MYCNTSFLNVVNGDETSDSGREFQMLMECGTNDLWKAFVHAKGWWRRCCLLVRWQKWGLCEMISVGKKQRPCTILYSVHMLECSLLDSKEGISTMPSRSWYPVSHLLVITLMANFSTSSISLTSLRMEGFQTGLAYSRCGLTIDRWSCKIALLLLPGAKGVRVYWNKPTFGNDIQAMMRHLGKTR